MTAGGGDVDCAAALQHADREVAQGRHDDRTVSGPDLGQVFTDGDVAGPTVTRATSCAKDSSAYRPEQVATPWWQGRGKVALWGVSRGDTPVRV